MNWWKQFKPKACSVSLKASDKEQALREMVDNAVKGAVLSDALVEPAVAALLEREELASTGVGMNVAIPHVKIEGIETAVCTLSVHKEGLEWAAVDGAPVQILFMILRPASAGPEHDPDQHLEMMRWIAKVARESDFRAFALQAKTKTDLVNLLKEMSAV
ncbi:MAG: PTS sugar transporter subunit IIA [bacterium]|nr:PTS sugar transporter subunit IIA [bacterium]